jgi:hypothetical protein
MIGNVIPVDLVIELAVIDQERGLSTGIRDRIRRWPVGIRRVSVVVDDELT